MPFAESSFYNWQVKFGDMSFLETFEKNTSSCRLRLTPLVVLKDILSSCYTDAPTEDTASTFGRDARYAAPHVRNH